MNFKRVISENTVRSSVKCSLIVRINGGGV